MLSFTKGRCGFGGNPDPQGEKVITQIKQNIINRKYSAIILKRSEPVFFQAELDQYYTPKLHLLPDSKVFYPVTGYLTRPDTLYVPKDQP